MTANYQNWIGRSESIESDIAPWPLGALSATLDREPYTSHIVPPLWHWLYFLPAHRQSELGIEGHAELGAFLPPVTLPRRMWAGGRLEFLDPLRVGDKATRESKIVDIKEKQGRSGPLVFVVVRHEIRTSRGLALTEEHDIVYRDHAAPGEAPAAPQAPANPAWQRTIRPDDVLLFRYSALTFNSHRIHYDRRYCIEAEHYPGLVVHGPLIATLLLDLAREHAPKFEVKRFQFRAVSPLFDTEPFTICGKPDGSKLQLWAQTESKRLAMQAEAA